MSFKMLLHLGVYLHLVEGLGSFNFLGPPYFRQSWFNTLTGCIHNPYPGVLSPQLNHLILDLLSLHHFFHSLWDIISFMRSAPLPWHVFIWLTWYFWILVLEHLISGTTSRISSSFKCSVWHSNAPSNKSFYLASINSRGNPHYITSNLPFASTTLK